MFEDTSTECAICLESLYDSTSGKKDNDGRRVITLNCGHKWHYDCLIQQIEMTKPNVTKRLLFNGCQCAKCGMVCSNHPDLQDVPIARTTNALRQKVDRLLQEQILLIVSSNTTTTNTSNNDELQKQQRDVVLEDARRKYAFYLCRHCEEPYFGGTIECADDQNQQTNSNNNEDDEEEIRLCPACTPQSQIVCQNPLVHQAYLVWKCRYCCQPATHVCYGNIHFCNTCHDRNSQRVHALSSSSSSSIQPPPLKPIPCPGIACTNNTNNACHFPKKDEGQTHHCNGSTKDCEQVYGCTCCQSLTNHQHLQQQQQDESGSPNLLTNPSGQLGLRGWNQQNPNMSWQVEQTSFHHLAPGNTTTTTTTTTNFVSSYLPCIMTQTLDLRQYISLPTTQWNCQLEVSARFRSRTDCPSVFRLQAILSNANQRPLQKLSTPTLPAPPDYWDRARLIFEQVTITNNNHDEDAIARFVTIVIMGQDSRFWRGHFGSKVMDCSIRILGTNEDLERILIPQTHIRQHQNHQKIRLFITQAILPIVGFVIFVWLFSDK